MVCNISESQMLYYLYSSKTARFMKTFPSVYSFLMNTIYLTQSTEEVAEGTVFKKHGMCIRLLYLGSPRRLSAVNCTAAGGYWA